MGIRRLMPNRKVAHVLDARIAAANADGSWRKLREELIRGPAAKRLTLGEASTLVEAMTAKTKSDAPQIRTILAKRIVEPFRLQPSSNLTTTGSPH